MHARYLDSLWTICAAYALYEQRTLPDAYARYEWRALFHLSQILRSQRKKIA